ncbi:MAG: Uma2 family endonuclease [Xenococcaceae cyanobacterium]
MTALVIDFQAIQLTDEQFFQLCQDNRDYRFERSAKGEIIIMPPTGGGTGNRNAGITAQLWIWNEQNKLGKVFDSSSGFKLANGATLSPDASWLELSRWNSLTEEQKEKFIPLCPDFVIELLSPTNPPFIPPIRGDRGGLQEKMQEYLENGTSLGWLINRKSKQIEIYRQGQEVEILKSPNTLSGENILPGFILNLEFIW